MADLNRGRGGGGIWRGKNAGGGTGGIFGGRAEPGGGFNGDRAESRRGGQTADSGQKIKYQVDAVLDGLIFKMERKGRSV